jgi:hypothetical protein
LYIRIQDKVKISPRVNRLTQGDIMRRAVTNIPAINIAYIIKLLFKLAKPVVGRIVNEINHVSVRLNTREKRTNFWLGCII